ncbi:MAG: hypothetical protein AAB513_03735 [Patescibacteria group bacterium]
MDTNNEKLLGKVRAVAEGVVWASILVAVLTIGGELYAPLKDSLKSIFTHHWLGKSALAIIIFVLVFLVRFSAKADMEKVRRALILATWCAVFSAVAMTTLFIAHTLHWF